MRRLFRKPHQIVKATRKIAAKNVWHFEDIWEKNECECERQAKRKQTVKRAEKYTFAL